MRAEEEIRKRLENLEKASATEGPYAEQKNIEGSSVTSFRVGSRRNEHSINILRDRKA
jgi:hypothetical protein